MNGCCVVGSRRLFVSADGDFLACERIGNSPSIGDINQGIIEEKIYKKYVYEFSKFGKIFALIVGLLNFVVVVM